MRKCYFWDSHHNREHLHSKPNNNPQHWFTVRRHYNTVTVCCPRRNHTTIPVTPATGDGIEDPAPSSTNISCAEETGNTMVPGVHPCVHPATLTQYKRDLLPQEERITIQINADPEESTDEPQRETTQQLGQVGQPRDNNEPQPSTRVRV